jgi:hypothetical protein
LGVRAQIQDSWVLHAHVRNLGLLPDDDYTVIQNFGFSLPKNSVLKNLLNLPIIQLMFRVKSTKHSSQFQRTRNFVFGKIYKFNTKLRDFSRNI